MKKHGHSCHIIDNNEIAKIRYQTPKGENVEMFFYLAIDDGLYLGEVEEKDKEDTVWKNIDEIEETLSYENLKELWRKIKNDAEKVMKNKCNIFLSKKEKYLGSATKIKNSSKVPVNIIWIEDFMSCENKKEILEDSIIYFLCNTSLIETLMKEIENVNCFIINKNFFKNNYEKEKIQNILASNNVKTPKIYCIDNNYENLVYPVFCKENKHAGMILKAYTQDTIVKFFERFDSRKFYLEESIEGDTEAKIYFVKNKIYYNKNIVESDAILETCKKVSKILNLDIFSIDFIKNNNEYVVIDVNPSAGFYMLDEARKDFINELEKLKV